MQEETSQLQFCNIQFKDLLQKASQCKIKIVGIIKSVFSAKKYIVEVYVNEEVFIRTIRKYNQFEATYEVIKMKFRNFDLGFFPSKYQVFGKDQTRKQYFEWLMNKIVQNYVRNPDNQASKRLLSILYLFMTRSLTHKEKYLKQSNNQSQSLKTFQRKRKLSLHQQKGQFIQSQETSEKLPKNKLQLSDTKPNNLTEYQKQRHRVRRNSQGSIIQFQIPEQKKEAKIQKINQIQSEQVKGKVPQLLIKLERNFSKKQNRDFYFQIRFQNQTQWRKRYLKIDNSSLLIYKDKMENHFRTKIQLYRIQVQNYHRQKNLLDEFCQKMEINNEPQFPQDQTIIALSHEYDFQKLLIRGIQYQPLNEGGNFQKMRDYNLNEQLKLQYLCDLIKKASQKSPINQKFEGVFNPIGKIFIVIHKLMINGIDTNQKDILKIKIKTLNLDYECKKLILKSQNTIKQAFLIPISNAFQAITIQALVSREEGWIRQQFKDFNLGYYPIQFSQILTKPSGYKFQKINVALIKSTQTSNQFINTQARLEYSLQNYSHFSSIYSESFANQNDGKIISGLKLEDMDELSVTVDRVLRIIGHIALFITKFWRNVYLFKYPKVSKVFFTFLLLLCILAQIKVFITIGFMILIFAILYNHPKLHKPLSILIQETLFLQIHPDFIPPQCLGTTQIKYRKWCQALDQIAKQFQLSKDNKLQKKQNLEKISVIQYKFNVHEKTFRVTQQVKGFFGKVFEGKKVIEIVSRIISGIVNTVQKCCNIFLWIDTKRSCLFLIVLIIFSGVANDFLVRIIGIIFCMHRLYKGMNFYKSKHYQRNRKVAVFTLRYIIQKHFANLIYVQQSQTYQSQIQNDIKKTIKQSKSLKDLDDAISLIQFSLSDQNGLKKLKNQLLKLICVYLDIDELKQQSLQTNNLRQTDKSTKKSDKKLKGQKEQQKVSTLTQSSNSKNQTVSLGRILNIIETCQTRLSLDWVPGKQGLSNQFQELKKQTKEIPLIDIWIEQMLTNFILNIPSQMFIKLKSQNKRQASMK